VRVAVAWGFLGSSLAFGALLSSWWLPLGLLVAAIALNLPLVTSFYRANGAWFAFRAILFHQIHYAYTSAAYVACRLGWAPDRPRRPGKARAA
jgi:hypothetical protein